MEPNELLSKCDHTLLSQTATWEEIKSLCDDGIKYNTASICIPPSYVEQAKAYVGDRLKICTVIGFPNGYSTTAVKLYETADALKNGADEIDMVINIGFLKDKLYDEIYSEIRQAKQLCGSKILKVIIETCLLTDSEKVEMCHIVTRAGADYIKTSTGFSTHGATLDDVVLLRSNVGNNVKVKAAGGIADLESAEAFIKNGADRLGTSKIVKLIKLSESSKRQS